MLTSPKVAIELSYPIAIDATEVKVLQMRRPKVADVLLLQKQQGQEAEKEIKLFANLCEISPDDIGRLDMMDYAKLQEQYANFMAPEREKKNSEESAPK
ncbi:phage tail assembly protein [Synergistes jonesii]|uniref:phage tail assembly protein n=1 Tax=Synergistes jonesii TaxID=2754 RepID=UPI00248EC7DE|nr:phage tail assembly protein [Synergistes jonesii]